MANLEIMGPGFFMFFHVDPVYGGGQIGRNRPSTIPEIDETEDDEAIALSLLILTCDC